MNCLPDPKNKYMIRKSPPIPANSCNFGEIRKGNDGINYKIVEFNSRGGMTNKWQKCGTNCETFKSKKIITKDKTSIKNYLVQAKEIFDNIYKTWNKISKISQKIYNNKNSIEYHPDYEGLGGWSYPTKSKYLDLKKCLSKRECNKIMKLLKEDLALMERTLKRAIKLETNNIKNSLKVKSKKYILKEGSEDKKTYKLNLVLLKTIKGASSSDTELYFKILGKYPKFLLDYNFGDSLLIANKNSSSFDKRMYIGDVDYILEEIKIGKINKSLKVKSKTKYSNISEWRKLSPIGKKFNKMVKNFNNISEYEWDYKLAEEYNLEEKKIEKIFDKPIKFKKQTKSEALKNLNEIYKIWDKVAKKSNKIHGYKEHYAPNPQFHNILAPKSFNHKIKSINNDGFPLECKCGLTTGDKYINYENCIHKELPKKECDKYSNLLKKDLSKIKQVIDNVDKKFITKKHTKTPVKVMTKKQTKSEALKLRNEVYKTWDKVAKKSKKRYGVEEYLIEQPYDTDKKYLDYEACISNSKPKRECNKIVTMLKKDLSKMNKALDKVNKKCPKGKVINKTGICSKSLTKDIKKINKIAAKANNTLHQIKSKKTVLWDVKKKGVMLAHTFKDHKTGKINNPPKGFGKAPEGWYASEKYDGYRAIWNGIDFVSRNGNIFHAPSTFKKWLPTHQALDGELFIGRESFEKHGLIRQKAGDEKDWSKVKYQIFDSPTIKGDFETRQTKIKKIISDSCKKMKGTCPLKYTTQKKIKSEIELYKLFDTLTKKGAEGVMLRSPKSPYESKRSKHLLKVKQLFDDECKIIGYKNGSGKYSKMLGAFKCQMVKKPNSTFTISGMNDDIRKNYLKTHPLGTIVTFTYMGLSENGIPRHPNYLRIRK